MTTSALGWLKPILRNEPIPAACSPVTTKPHLLKPIDKPQNNEKKNKKSIYDYHWLVWKTGLTPTPVPVTPGPPTPAPPTPGPQRGYTPIIEDDVPLPAHLCDTDRPTSGAARARPAAPDFR